MNDTALQQFKDHAFQGLAQYMPEIPTITNVVGGMCIGVFGQPLSNWKRACQHAPKGTTNREIYNRITAPRVIDIAGRVVTQGGGIRNFWDALPWGMLGSTVKQGTKGTVLVKVDNAPLPAYVKAVISAGIITAVITPFDRISNALVSNKNKHLSKRDVIKMVYQGGRTSIYKGAKTNIVKDLIEASLIYLTRYLFKKEKTEHKLTPLEAAKGALFSMTAFYTTICKLVITQPLDGIKAFLQQGLEQGTPTTALMVVRQQGLYKLFTAGLEARFILNYLSITVSLLGMHINDILQEQKKLDSTQG